MDRELELIKGLMDLTRIVSGNQESIHHLVGCIEALKNRIDQLEANVK